MTKDEKNRAVAMRRNGLGYTTIAKMLGLSENTVKSYCRHTGLGKEDLRTEPALPNMLVEKTCLYCGAVFIQYPNCKVKKFCSTECRNKYWNRHINDERRKSMETYVCSGCGKPFMFMPATTGNTALMPAISHQGSGVRNANDTGGI